MNPLLFQEKGELLPLHFQKLFERLKLIKEISQLDLLFIAVLYNILESGFIIRNDKFDEVVAFDFNLKALKLLDDMPLELLYKKNEGSHIIFEAKLRFGAVGNPEVTLMGQPSYYSNSKYLAINMFIKHPCILVSFCFKLSDWLGVKFDPYKFKDRGTFSNLVKDNLAVPIKNALAYYLNLNNAPVLNRLPQHVIKKILSYLNSQDVKKLKIAINY